jgi:hypothetical protein
VGGSRRLPLPHSGRRHTRARVAAWATVTSALPVASGSSRRRGRWRNDRRGLSSMNATPWRHGMYLSRVRTRMPSSIAERTTRASAAFRPAAVNSFSTSRDGALPTPPPVSTKKLRSAPTSPPPFRNSFTAVMDTTGFLSAIAATTDWTSAGSSLAMTGEALQHPHHRRGDRVSPPADWRGLQAKALPRPEDDVRAAPPASCCRTL